MKKLYIVDAVNFLFRAYYAIGPMTNAQGESTSALFGFIRSLFKIIQDFSPDYFVAVFDGPDNKRSRTALYSEYKSHRTGMPEDLVPQLEKALSFCDIAGIPHLSVPGVEADDTMGSIARWAEGQGLRVYLCSSDKDLCQLITDHIFVINPHKDNLLIDRHQVKTLFGIYPEQMIDYLALVGDASDNIPGLEGFGPKTAAALLGEFQTLENILDHPEKIAGKKREILTLGKETALLSKQLATIDIHIDFPKDLAFFQLQEPNLDQIRAFYHEMHFLSLLKELKAELPEQIKTAYHLVDDIEALRQLVAELQRAKTVCIDTEATAVQPMQAALVGIGLGMESGTAWYVPMNGKLGKQMALKLLKPLLENGQMGLVGHNIKYDLHVLLNEGIQIHTIASDTMLASYLICPHIPRHGLDQLALEKFGKVKIPIEELIGKGKQQITMDAVPIEKVCTYCCEDVDYTMRLHALFEKELKELELVSLFEQIEIPLIPILMRMERNGIFINVKLLHQMAHHLAESLTKIEDEIYTLAQERFNLNSPKQLSIILFEKMGIKAPKKTATGYSTAVDVLESLQEEAPIVKKIITYRTLEKLRSTYVDALPGQVLPTTHRIHCSFNQSVAATGRLSCQDPNLQNIPIRTEMGRKIREAFQPERADHSYVGGDYSQIELRLLAHFSEDPALMCAFREGVDIHAYTASLVFNKPLQEVTPHMRHLAKAVNFGIVYGQTAFGLSQQLGIGYSEAEEFIETYFNRYKKVREYIAFCIESAKKTGRVVTLTGRQRPLPEIHSKNPSLRSQAERLAVNTPLQGTNADLIKMAMIQIDTHLRAHPQMGMMILQIHDELLFETPDSTAKELGAHVKRIMEGVVKLQVPLIVDISIGKNWSEC